MKTIKKSNLVENNITYLCYKVSSENKVPKYCLLVSTSSGQKKTAYSKKNGKYTVLLLFDKSLEKLRAKEVVICNGFNPENYSSATNAKKAIINNKSKSSLEQILIAKSTSNKLTQCKCFGTCQNVTPATKNCGFVQVRTCKKVSNIDSLCKNFNVCNNVLFTSNAKSFGTTCSEFGKISCVKVVKVKDNITTCTRVASCYKFVQGKKNKPSTYETNSESACIKVNINAINLDDIEDTHVKLSIPFLNSLEDEIAIDSNSDIETTVCLNVNSCYLVNRFGAQRTCNNVGAAVCNTVSIKHDKEMEEDVLIVKKAITCNQVLPNVESFKFNPKNDCNSVSTTTSAKDEDGELEISDNDAVDTGLVNQEQFELLVNVEGCNQVAECMNVNSNGACGEFSKTTMLSKVSNFSATEENGDLCLNVTSCDKVSMSTGICDDVSAQRIEYISPIEISTDSHGNTSATATECEIVSECINVNPAQTICNDFNKKACKLVTTGKVIIDDACLQPSNFTLPANKIVADSQVPKDSVRMIDTCRFVTNCNNVTYDGVINSENDDENTMTYVLTKYILPNICKYVAECTAVTTIDAAAINNFLIGKEELTTSDLDNDDCIFTENAISKSGKNEYNISLEIPTEVDDNIEELRTFLITTLIKTFRTSKDAIEIEASDIRNNISSMFLSKDKTNLSNLSNTNIFSVYAPEYFNNGHIDTKHTKFVFAYTYILKDDDNIEFKFEKDGQKTFKIFVYLSDLESKFIDYISKNGGIFADWKSVNKIAFSFKDMNTIYDEYSETEENVQIRTLKSIKEEYDRCKNLINKQLIETNLAFNLTNNFLGTRTDIKLLSVVGTYDENDPIDLERLVLTTSTVSEIDVANRLVPTCSTEQENSLNIDVSLVNKIKSIYYEKIIVPLLNDTEHYDFNSFRTYKNIIYSISSERILIYIGYLLCWLLDDSSTQILSYTNALLLSELQSPYGIIKSFAYQFKKEYLLSDLNREAVKENGAIKLNTTLSGSELAEFKEELYRSIAASGNGFSDITLPDDISSPYENELPEGYDSKTYYTKMLLNYYTSYIANINSYSLTALLEVDYSKINSSLKSWLTSEDLIYTYKEANNDDEMTEEETAIELKDVLNESLFDYFTVKFIDAESDDYVLEIDNLIDEVEDDEFDDLIDEDEDDEFNALELIDLLGLVKEIDENVSNSETRDLQIIVPLGDLITHNGNNVLMIIKWHLNYSNFYIHMAKISKFKFNELPNIINGTNGALTYDVLKENIKKAIVGTLDTAINNRKVKASNQYSSTAIFSTKIIGDLNKLILDKCATYFTALETFDAVENENTDYPIFKKLYTTSTYYPAVTICSLMYYLNNIFEFKKYDKERFGNSDIQYFSDKLLNLFGENSEALNMNVLVSKTVHLLNTSLNMENIDFPKPYDGNGGFGNPNGPNGPSSEYDDGNQNENPFYEDPPIDPMPFEFNPDDGTGKYEVKNDSILEDDSFIGATSNVNNDELNELKNTIEIIEN